MRVGLFLSAAHLSPRGGLVAPPGLGQCRAFRAVCRATGSNQDAGQLTANEIAWPAADAAAQNQQQPEAAAGQQQPLRRGPGRPPGIPAWNKGVPHTEAHRKRISMKLKQKWKDPEFKRNVTQSMLGKPAWNAGQAHEPETLRKMSEAKLGRRQPLATRKLMSQAHMGRGMSDEGKAVVADRFRGKPKSQEHRSKLAAIARRRHAATRVLRAVEAVYSAASTPGPSAGTPAPPGVAASPRSGSGTAGAPPAGSRAGMGGGAAPPSAPSKAVRAAAYSMGLTGLSDGNGKRLSRTQILNTFKAELREYRTLQEELSTWTAAFREKNNRKPSLVDVQRTGIPWLIEKFKQYVVLRDRLFSDTSVLRGKLQEAIPDPESLRSANGGSGAALGGPGGIGSMGPINANRSASGPRSAVASRFSAVMDYKLQRQAKEGGGGAAAAVQPPAGAAAGAAPPGARQQQQAEEAAAEAADAQLASKVMSSQAPPRVRMAMAAALEYRQQKAQATKAAADAAAAAARVARSSSAAVAAAATAGSQLGARAGAEQAAAAGAPAGVKAAATQAATRQPPSRVQAPIEPDLELPVVAAEACLPLHAA